MHPCTLILIGTCGVTVQWNDGGTKNERTTRLYMRRYIGLLRSEAGSTQGENNEQCINTIRVPLPRFTRLLQGKRALLRYCLEAALWCSRQAAGCFSPGKVPLPSAATFHTNAGNIILFRMQVNKEGTHLSLNAAYFLSLLPAPCSLLLLSNNSTAGQWQSNQICGTTMHTNGT